MAGGGWFNLGGSKTAAYAVVTLYMTGENRRYGNEGKIQKSEEGAKYNMKTYRYKTKGSCSTEIIYSVDEGKIVEIDIRDGCNGNIQGLMKLVLGMDVQDVIEKLKGIDCKGKGTSCPDQLAKALELAVSQ